MRPVLRRRRCRQLHTPRHALRRRRRRGPRRVRRRRRMPRGLRPHWRRRRREARVSSVGGGRRACKKCARRDDAAGAARKRRGRRCVERRRHEPLPLGALGRRRGAVGQRRWKHAHSLEHFGDPLRAPVAHGVADLKVAQVNLRYNTAVVPARCGLWRISFASAQPVHACAPPTGMRCVMASDYGQRGKQLRTWDACACVGGHAGGGWGSRVACLRSSLSIAARRTMGPRHSPPPPLTPVRPSHARGTRRTRRSRGRWRTRGRSRCGRSCTAEQIAAFRSRH